MSDTKYYEDAYNEELDCKYWNEENDYHKQISKDLQSSYDLGCITTIEKMQKWCTEQSRILEKQSEDFNDEECFGGYRAFEDMIRYLDTIKQTF